MRSYNQLHHNNFFFNLPQAASSVPPLTSHLLDVFDTSLPEPSTMGKQRRQPYDFSLSHDLHKKFKTSLNAHQLMAQPTMTTLHEVLSQQAPVFNNIPSLRPPLSSRSQAMNEQFRGEIGRLQQLQNFNLYMTGQTEQHHSFPRQILGNPIERFNTIGKSQDQKTSIVIKEEHVGQEETISSSKWESLCAINKLSDSDEKSEINAVTDACSEIEAPAISHEDEKEPALFEFTRAFPDWDLITMFRFMRGKKSKDEFERDLKIKIEKKLRKRKNLARRKEKALVSKAKQPKGRKKAAGNDDYKPSKAVTTKATA